MLREPTYSPQPLCRRDASLQLEFLRLADICQQSEAGQGRKGLHSFAEFSSSSGIWNYLRNLTTNKILAATIACHGSNKNDYIIEILAPGIFPWKRLEGDATNRGQVEETQGGRRR